MKKNLVKKKSDENHVIYRQKQSHVNNNEMFTLTRTRTTYAYTYKYDFSTSLKIDVNDLWLTDKHNWNNCWYKNQYV